MLSKSLTFFIGIIIFLFTSVFCFPRTVTAQSEIPQLISLPIQGFIPNGFVVYGRAPTQAEAGIEENVQYKQTTEPLLDLETFFNFGGTLELLTTNLVLSTHDVVISEIMWGIDESYPTDGDDTYTQWIELYNTYPGGQFTPPLFLLFTPFKGYTDRHTVELPNGQQALVLDAISNLHLGRWDLPGKSGRRPYSSVVSAYRNIVYADDTNPRLRRAIVPFGSYRESWKETPKRGRRNTLFNIIDDSDRAVSLPYIATPGTRHVPDSFLHAVTTTSVQSDRVVINEVRNDISHDNFDWIELKNASRSAVQLEDWELSIVTGVGADTDLVDLPHYTLAPGDILLLQRRHPRSTILAGGINIENPDELKTRGATHKYFVAPALDLPNTGKFLLLLRSESDKNGQDVAIEDYAGNGFFSDPPNTDFWPRFGQPRPTDIAHFGNYGTFASLDSTWVRLRYESDDGHHKDAWRKVGSQGRIGYAPRADKLISPGTPGYENNALKTHIGDGNFGTFATDSRYDGGEITISEIMSDAGPRQNKSQWIELYNSSLTQAANLEGWELKIYNLEDDIVPYVNGSFIFNEVVILPNQTLLIVSKSTPLSNVIDNRVYDLHQQHRHELRLSNRWSSLLNPSGFHIKLISTGDPQRSADDVIVDDVGNLSVESREPIVLWDLPERDPEVRLSLVRQYGLPFRPNQGRRDGTPDHAAVGTLPEAWRRANKHYVSPTYYGDDDDSGTPGYRLGGPLPVQLSNFHPEQTRAGVVIIGWTTESELDNAGFNILRSYRRDSAFIVINPSLILGAGTTSEKQTYSYIDTTAKPNVVYYYQIEDISFSGVRRTLATVRLKGNVSPTGKLISMWSELKTQD